MKKRLRSGFTTGACAAAAAKAAAHGLLHKDYPKTLKIPFPDGRWIEFSIHRYEISDGSVLASVIKDAGDDPDVTNGAEIIAEVSGVGGNPEFLATDDCVPLANILLCRGRGVGKMTKPGLAIPPGEPAINPVPRQMITQAVGEITSSIKLRVTISVDNGEVLATKTLNNRLGIVDGISILGTTGIVRPISADAWTATIQASLDVAQKAGLQDIVLSTGRTSEKGAQQLLNLPEEAYAMMGDYLEFSLKEAALRKFSTIHLSGMWAKITKAALKVPQTHVRNGALEVEHAAKLLETLGADGNLLRKIQQANTAREILSHIETAGRDDLVKSVCLLARDFCREITGLQVKVYLVDHKAHIITHV